MKDKLNLGCGKDYRKGYINVDFEGKADVCHDLNVLPYPFKDNTFDEIYAKNVMEHLDSNKQTEIFNEFYRIAKPNCLFIVIVAYGVSWMNFIDHTRGYTFKTFLGLCSENNPLWITKGRFKLLGFKQRPFKYARFIPPYPRRILSYFFKNLINCIEVRMKVLK